MNTTTTAAILTMPGLPSRPDNDLEEQINKVYEKFRYGLFYYGMKFKNAVKNHIHYLFHGESGIGTIEMVLILVEKFIDNKHVFSVYIMQRNS